MKTRFFIYMLIYSLTFISCEKENSGYNNYSEYLTDKNIYGIVWHDDVLWVFSSMVDRNSERPSYMCSLPMTHQVTKISGNEFSYKEGIPYMKPFKAANDGKLYTFRMNEIAEVKDIDDYYKIYSNDSLYIFDFIIEGENLWFTCQEGLGKVVDNKLNLIKEVEGIDLTETQLSLAIDNNNVIWVLLHSAMQILRIEGETIQLINKQELGIVSQEYSSLGEINIDNNNNVYVSVYGDTDESKILKYDGSIWAFQTIPVSNQSYIMLSKDSQNRLWIIENTYSENEGIINNLFYLNEGNWTEVDLSDIDTYTNCIETHGDTLYLGTVNGIKTITIN